MHLDACCSCERHAVHAMRAIASGARHFGSMHPIDPMHACKRLANLMCVCHAFLRLPRRSCGCWPYARPAGLVPAGLCYGGHVHRVHALVCMACAPAVQPRECDYVHAMQACCSTFSCWTLTHLRAATFKTHLQ